jgi:8-oxo-dGTP diphosphatase
MPRYTRYEGVIVRDDLLLLIRHLHHESGRTYWLFPGGGKEAGETEEDCLRREMQEETNLVVQIDRLLIDQDTEPDADYVRRKMFLCHPISGTASPGFEPELEAAAEYGIAEVRWFDLREPGKWDPLLVSDVLTYPLLLQVRHELGYKNMA